MEDVIYARHGIAARLQVAYVSDKKLDLVCHVRVFHLVLVTHIILLLLIAGEDADFSDIRTEEAIQHCVTEGTCSTSNHESFSCKNAHNILCLFLFCVVILCVPLCKVSQSFPQTCVRLEAKVLLQRGGVGIGDGDVTRLHRDELLMGLKVVALRQYSCTYKLFLENRDEVEEILGGVVADVIHHVRRNGKSVLAVLFLGGMLHNADHSFHNVIYKSEVTLAVAVVKDFDGLALDQFIGETKVGHVGTACWTIDGKEAEAR